MNAQLKLSAVRLCELLRTHMLANKAIYLNPKTISKKRIISFAKSLMPQLKLIDFRGEIPNQIQYQIANKILTEFKPFIFHNILNII